MHSAKLDSRGFTLIASLMLLLIMSGVSIGLLMMVDTESKVGSQDTQNTLAFHAAEGGIEHMTADLTTKFQNILSPTALDIESLSALAPPNTPFMSYPLYTLTPAQNPDGTLAFRSGKVPSGVNKDLYASILDVTLQVTATTSLAGLGIVGDEVNMSRKVEVALVPVFQFGVFSDGDLSFFAGPNLDFAGRVHTNGDLFLLEGTGGTVKFHDKVSAWGNVIRWELANGTTAAATAHLGAVDILTTASGCDGAAPPPATCRDMGKDTVNGTDESSVLPGSAPATWTTGGQNPAWPTTISGGDYGTWIIDGNYGSPGGSGARKLSLPFINNGPAAGPQPQPFEIIRRPPPGEISTTPLGASRLYNEAQIRVLLSDTPVDLPGGLADPQNIRLANVGGYVTGVPIPTLGLLGDGGTRNLYFASGTTAYPNPSTWSGATFAPGTVKTLPPDWAFAPLQPIAADITFTNDQGPPAAPLTTPAGSANAAGLTAAPPALTLAGCPVVTGVPACPAPPVPYYTGLYPYFALPTAVPPIPAPINTWNLNDGYLRVEYIPLGGGAPIAITTEWLGLGFARGMVPPTAPGADPISPNAILRFQEPADRDSSGNAPDDRGLPPTCSRSATGVWTCIEAKPPEVWTDAFSASDWYGDGLKAAQSVTMNNWYPINLYDSREGEPRDNVGAVGGPNTCTPAGLMNVVELDVGNLKKWLNGTIAGSGNRVDYVTQNGYVLYFSDRRGMLPNPNGTSPVGAPNTKTGDSGLEDSINTASVNGTPNGALEPAPPALPPPAPAKPSPEDVNQNGFLDNFGAGNIGLGLGYVGVPYTAVGSVNSKILNAAGAPDPYLTAGRLPACTIGQKNWVSGARHVLKLTDGSLGNVPVRLDNAQGGFTVASENPVYVYGDYNSSVADPMWLNPNGPEPAHAAAAVIADAVTILSNGWSDLASLKFPTDIGGRTAATTYYRVAVSGGKNINFSVNGLAYAGGDFGTDGGVHNFLRLLENWGGQTLNYKGSLVSMYYSTYATGVDRDGGTPTGTTYSPPTRNYIFDPLFTQPQNLPPGTPLFRDIDNLTYRQSFTPHTGCF